MLRGNDSARMTGEFCCTRTWSSGPPCANCIHVAAGEGAWSALEEAMPPACHPASPPPRARESLTASQNRCRGCRALYRWPGEHWDG